MRITATHSFIVIIYLFCLCSYGQQNKSQTPFEPYTNDAEIEVVLKGAAPGKAYLYGVFGNQNIIKDSTIADSSAKVVFKSAKRFPAGFYYAVYSDNAVMTFLMDKNQHF